jgi:predicted porin
LKKTALIGLAALPLCGLAHAQSSVTLYGMIDLGIVYSTNQLGGHEVQMLNSIAQGSRWGLKGSEDLGGGLRAIFTLENGFTASNGALGQGGLEFGRQAFVGIASNNYGTVTLGRQYEEVVDYISDTTTDRFSILFQHPGDNDLTNRGLRTSSAVKYQSPVMGGARFSALYGFGGQPGSVTNLSIYSLGGSYSVGNLYLGAAYTHIDKPGQQTNLGRTWFAATNVIDGVYSLTASSNDVAAIGAKYTFGAATAGLSLSQSRFNNVADVGTARFQNVDMNLSYFFTPSLMLGGAFVYTNALIDSRNIHPRYEQANLMLDYFLSKATDVYVMAASQWANGGATQAQSSQFISASSSNRQSTFTLGMRHKF